MDVMHVLYKVKRGVKKCFLVMREEESEEKEAAVWEEDNLYILINSHLPLYLNCTNVCFQALNHPVRAYFKSRDSIDAKNNTLK